MPQGRASCRKRSTSAAPASPVIPGYLSARVTLGRALLELNDLDEAQSELEQVLRSAPENLAARRALGETLHRRGDLSDALTQYRAALSLAKNDPDLQETVNALAKEVEPEAPAAANDGLSFEQAAQEFLRHGPKPAAAAPAADLPLAAPATGAAPETEPDLDLQAEPILAVDAAATPDAAESALPTDADMWARLLGETPTAPEPEAEAAVQIAPEPEAIFVAEPESGGLVTPEPELVAAAEDHSERDRAVRTIAALGQFLDAVHVARTQPTRLAAATPRCAPGSPPAASTRSSSPRCRTSCTSRTSPAAPQSSSSPRSASRSSPISAT